MIPHVSRGDRVQGLMVYLSGPGRHNEHIEPHLVAGSAGVMAWYDTDELSRASALAIAEHVDRPRVLHETTVAGGHVWHCSLSLRADEGELSDDKWGAIARDFVAKMHLDDNEGTKAGTRWVAVRHGKSTGGNDHIHIALNLVREDGTKVDVGNDYARAQRAARDLEREHGLRELDTSHPEKAYKRGEREAAARRTARAQYERTAEPGARPWKDLPAAERKARETAALPAEQPRVTLGRRVRACAAASTDEAQFVRQLRGSGLLVRPFFAAGRNDVVAGYSVALRPSQGERPIFYSGTRLASDLSLPRLREAWPDTPQTATAAAAEWTAAKRNRRTVDPRADRVVSDPAVWEQRAAELAALREQLRGIPVDDRATWARVAGQTAGAFAAWSQRTERTPGPLAATADALAKSAQIRRRPVSPKPTGIASTAGTSLLLMQAAGGGTGTTSEAILLRQLANLVKALHDMHRSAGQAQRAAQIAAAVRGELAKVAAAMEQHPAPTTAAAAGTATATRERTAAEQETFETRERMRQQYGAVRPLDAPLPNKTPGPARAPTGADAGTRRTEPGLER